MEQQELSLSTAEMQSSAVTSRGGSVVPNSTKHTLMVQQWLSSYVPKAAEDSHLHGNAHRCTQQIYSQLLQAGRHQVKEWKDGSSTREQVKSIIEF